MSQRRKPANTAAAAAHGSGPRPAAFANLLAKKVFPAPHTAAGGCDNAPTAAPGRQRRKLSETGQASERQQLIPKKLI